MPGRIEIYKSGSHDVQVIRSRRKTVSLKIIGDRAVLYVPLFTPVAEIVQFLKEKEGWISDKLSNPRSNARPVWQDGTEIWYLGNRYVLSLNHSPRGRVEFDGDTIRVYGPSENSWDKAWQKLAEETLDEELDVFMRQLEADPGDFTLKYRTYRSRWGTCYTRQKLIILNCWCVALPVQGIRYVFCHELAHLKVPNHQQVFYDRLGQLWPDYQTGLKETKKFVIL